MQLLRRWFKRALIVGGLLLFNFYLEYKGAFEPFALATYDWMERPARTAEPVRSPLVTVFVMGQLEEAPADNGRLSDEEKILRIIKMVACGNPAVIGVDWRSGSWQAEGIDSLKAGSAASTRIVWARERHSDGSIGPVAGGVSMAPQWGVGIAAVKPDRDGAIRRYMRWYEDGKETFAWSVVKAYCQSGAIAPGCATVQRCAQKEECGAEPLLNYRDGSARVNQFPAEVVDGLAGSRFTSCSALPGGGENPFIKGKIILIGDGSNADVHETAYGSTNGVAIMAHAIQGELYGSAIKEHGGVLVYLLHIVSVIVVIAINAKWRPLPALGFNVLALPALSLLFSYVAFSSFFHWFDFAPILAGVIIHQLYEQAKDNQELRNELAARHQDAPPDDVAEAGIPN